MHISTCCRCGEVSSDYVVDAHGTVYCHDCARVHSIDDTRLYECYECDNRAQRSDMHKMIICRKTVFVCNDCMSERGE